MEENKLYNVVWIGRKSLRRRIIKRSVGKEEAKRIVSSYPDSNRSMVFFEAR
jgi:hypothetical protein